MRRLFTTLLIGLAISGCKDPKGEEKAALNAVIQIHDKVMGREEQLMHNKMKLDTLFAKSKSDVAKAKITELTAKLAKADAAMSDWMQHFEPAPEGKNHEQLMTYFASQKKQVIAVDSLFVKAIGESTEYLKPFEKK